MAKIEIEVDDEAKAVIENLNSQITGLKRKNTTLTNKVEKYENEIEKMQRQLDGFKAMEEKLWKMHDIMKYKLKIDDGNERC